MGRLQIKKFAEVDLLEDSWYGGYYFDFFIITGKLTMALSIGSVEVISKLLPYNVHERVWENVSKEKTDGTNKEFV